MNMISGRVIIAIAAHKGRDYATRDYKCDLLCDSFQEYNKPFVSLAAFVVNLFSMCYTISGEVDLTTPVALLAGVLIEKSLEALK